MLKGVHAWRTQTCWVGSHTPRSFHVARQSCASLHGVGGRLLDGAACDDAGAWDEDCACAVELAAVLVEFPVRPAEPEEDEGEVGGVDVDEAAEALPASAVRSSRSHTPRLQTRGARQSVSTEQPSCWLSGSCGPVLEHARSKHANKQVVGRVFCT